jgi:hypothetical protein
VTSGNTYVVPPLPPASALVVTSWSTNASTNTGQMWKMKMWRKVGEPRTYSVVGHDGPRQLAPGVINTFSGLRVPVQPGDVLGLNDNAGSATATACFFDAPGETRLARLGDLADGDSGSFDPFNNRRINITAVVSPTTASVSVPSPETRRRATPRSRSTSRTRASSLPPAKE